MRPVIGLWLVWALIVAGPLPVSGADGDPPGQFLDIAGNTFEGDIEWLSAAGITKGCNPPDNTLFCPDGIVTRGQMAAFLVRALELKDDGGGDLFVDDDNSVFRNDIDRLATAGITKGCNPPANTMFCPDDPVTREAMAAFLVRALGLTENTHPGFRDVSSGNIFANDIGKLATVGITKGCNPPANDLFCPKGLVTRGQMAAFLHRAFSAGAVDGAPKGSIDSAIGSDVEAGNPTESDPDGDDAGEVDTPAPSDEDPFNPGVSGGDLADAPPPWEIMSQLAMEDLQVDFLTPSLSPPGEVQTGDLSTMADLGSILPWTSQGYLSLSEVPNAVGWIIMQFADGSLSYCSGTLVGRNVVLTAAHCLGAANYWFLPREYGVTSGHPYFTASQQFWPAIYPQLSGDIQNAFDYGVLILRTNSLGQHAGDIYGWFPIYMLGPTSTTVAAGQLLDYDWRRVSIGYPMEGWFQTYCNGHGCYPWQVDATEGQAWTLGGGFYLIGWGGQTSGGNSGGGVFTEINGRWYLVTMFTATTNEVTCAEAGFATYTACGSSPTTDRYYGNKMWGPPLLNTSGDYGFDDFWRSLFG